MTTPVASPPAPLLAVVTALPKEALAIEMLTRPARTVRAANPRDSNLYQVCRIGGHEVVLASLPAGIYGETSAAAVVGSLLHSFPSVRDVVVMGIAGGVPGSDRDEDVRLGDVVVSVPAPGRNAVIQWDFGKLSQGHDYENRSVAPLPSALLLNAVTRLSNDWRRAESPLERYVAAVAANLMEEEDKARYARPGSDVVDRLFQPDCVHVAGVKDCSQCDLSRQVTRVARASTKPKVFQGLVGSGDTLLKDASLREQLRSKYAGLRCIEMESAGAAQAVWQGGNVGYLFVRGICDYCDSHKNDSWQEYAAATAAAYVKCLLEVLPAGEPSQLGPAPGPAPAPASAPAPAPASSSHSSIPPELLPHVIAAMGAQGDVFRDNSSKFHFGNSYSGGSGKS